LFVLTLAVGERIGAQDIHKTGEPTHEIWSLYILGQF
jgi:hypothetical protein